MHPRLHTFAQAFRVSRQWAQCNQVGQRPRSAQFVCQSCRYSGFSSASSVLRKTTQASRRTLATAAKNVKEKKYPGNIVVYDAGPTRTSFVSTWKAIALLQFGTCCVFLTPMLYHNKNQPDKTVRVLQAAVVTVLSAIPSAILSFVTAPYVRQITLHPVPPAARHSLTALRAFVRNLPSTTKVTFQTLRIFPMPKHTTTFVDELRALPARKFRFANIELPKSNAWKKRQQEKGLWSRLWEVVTEPRFKFYVKEGRVYTMRTGVPGVWEEVAKGIQERTVEEQMIKDGKKTAKKGRVGIGLRKPVREPEELPRPVVKRQTARPTAK